MALMDFLPALSVFFLLFGWTEGFHMFLKKSVNNKNLFLNVYLY